MTFLLRGSGTATDHGGFLFLDGTAGEGHTSQGALEIRTGTDGNGPDRLRA